MSYVETICLTNNELEEIFRYCFIVKNSIIPNNHITPMEYENIYEGYFENMRKTKILKYMYNIFNENNIFSSSANNVMNYYTKYSDTKYQLIDDNSNNLNNRLIYKRSSSLNNLENFPYRYFDLLILSVSRNYEIIETRDVKINNSDVIYEIIHRDYKKLIQIRHIITSINYLPKDLINIVEYYMKLF